MSSLTPRSVLWIPGRPGVDHPLPEMAGIQEESGFDLLQATSSRSSAATFGCMIAISQEASAEVLLLKGERWFGTSRKESCCLKGSSAKSK